MLKNYITIAWRSLVRNKTFSAINISGMALGLACSLLIMLWVQDERSIDSFHANSKNLYQVFERRYYDGKIDANYLTQGLLADELKRGIPEIEYSSALELDMPRVFEAGDKTLKMEGMFAGADFFTLFSYPLLQGTPRAALSRPDAIAISRKMAIALFESPEKAIGKTLRYDDRENLLVSAVFKDLPANSSQQFEYLRSWEAFSRENASWIKSWTSASPATFVQLRADADPSQVQTKIRDFIDRYHPKDKNNYTELGLQLYKEKYLHSTFKNGVPDGGRIEYVRLFSFLAMFILLIACINFMNLATARSAKRAKEVGIRKVVGAARPLLIGQFIGEALLVTLVSVLIAFAMAILLMPAFNALTGKQLSLPLDQPAFWAALLGLLLVTGLVAGSYPALFLSSLNPIRVLKNSLKFGPRTLFLRKGLVVFQFALSIILIIGMIVVYRQMEYVHTKSLGYDRENLLYIPIEGELTKKYELFKEQAGQLTGILSVSKMKESPTTIGHHTGNIGWTGKDPALQPLFSDAVVGYDFVKTMDLKLLEGRDFSRDFKTDSDSYLLNETAVKRIGYKDPVGKPLWWGDRQGKIIGIVKDFHFASMHEAIEPLFIRLAESPKWGTILVRTEAGKTAQALASLEKICKELNPAFPFTCRFSDQEYGKLYKSEEIVSKLTNTFAFLAIFISCLGLFGLAAFTAEQRTKEIGVRKVLGASIQDIILLLSGNFLKPVLSGMLIAFPIAWYATSRWLQNFAYKITIEWWVFALAGLLTIGIALLTVSFQSIKSAVVNPVNSLRSE